MTPEQTRLAKSHIGKSVANNCWFVRYHGFATEDDARQFEMSVAERLDKAEKLAAKLQNINNKRHADNARGKFVPDNTNTAIDEGEEALAEWRSE